jgi:hypothetical protein
VSLSFGDKVAKDLAKMLDYVSFSAIRSANLCSVEALPANSTPLVERSYQRSYDTEWYGGQWDEEQLKGVILHYPEVGNGDLAVAEAWAGPNAQAPRAFVRGTYVDPIWAANANQLLGVLGLPVKIGSPEAEIRSLTAEPVNAVTNSDKQILNMKIVAPDLYYVQAILSEADGLLTLALYRVDLMKKSCSKSAWKMFVSSWK